MDRKQKLPRKASRRGITSHEREHMIKLTALLQGYVETEIRITEIRLRKQIADLRDRGFWSRMNWLLTGR